MTATTTTTAPYVPTGRPVRRFVLALLLVGAVASAVGWSGVVGPRLTADVEAVLWDGPTRSGSVLLRLTNRAPTTVELASIDVTFPLAVLDAPALTGRRVVGGESVLIEVPFTSECTAGPVLYEPMRVTVRTAIGLRRTTNLAGALQMGPFPCPG